MKLLFLAPAIFLAAETNNLQAEVNVKNGNFYLTYTDLTSPPAAEVAVNGTINIQRTYNSKSVESSEFGRGWGWLADTCLSWDNEGGITLQNNGSGLLQIGSDISKAASNERTLELLSSNSSLLPCPELENYTRSFNKWKEDKEQRLYWTAFGIRQGLEGFRHPALGWKRPYPSRCGTLNCQIDHSFSLTRTADGYERRGNDGERQKFDVDGRLVLVQKLNGYFYRIQRSQEKKVSRMVDVNGYEIIFEYDSKGVLTGLRDSAGKKTHYEFQDGDLVRADTSDGNTYLHGYDQNHNMTSIEYIGGSKMQMEYDKKSFVTKVIERDGQVTDYQYGTDPADPDHHYWTTVRKRDASGMTRVNERHEFTAVASPDGQLSTKEVVIHLPKAD